MYEVKKKAALQQRVVKSLQEFRRIRSAGWIVKSVHAL